MIEPKRTVTVEPVDPGNPSLAPDPRPSGKRRPLSSNTQIRDPRSIAIPIMADLLPQRKLMMRLQ
jgi:hypothetical protein